jgi:hypothetical protein
MGGSQRDNAVSVEQTGDGGFILTGSSGYFGAPAGELWLVKTDSQGNETWKQNYGFMPSAGWDVHQTTDGGYIVVGQEGPPNLLLIKTDAQGQIQKSTAREHLNAAQSAVNVSGASLIYAGSPQSDETGRALGWTYIFKTMLPQALYEVKVSGSRAVLQPDVTVGDPEISTDMKIFSGEWIDSDAAMTLAEQYGGSDFRQTQDAVNIQMDIAVYDLTYPRTEVPVENPVWRIMYRGNDGEKLVNVDAVFGAVLDENIEIPATSRELLSRVEEEAQSVYSDAELLFVKAWDADTQGDAPVWLYMFRSLNHQKFAEYVAANGLILRSYSSFWDDRIKLRMKALPDAWKDSDQVLKAAEAAGGKAFREANPTYNIDMDLTTFESSEAGGVRPTWQVFYTTPDQELRIRIDAVFGTTYDKIPRVSARDKLTAVQDLATSSDLMSGGSLIFVRAVDSDEQGEAKQWQYIYTNSAGDALYDITVFGGTVMPVDTCRLGGLSTDMTPLPDAWIDSDNAVRIAEYQGGQAFRNSYSDWTIYMDLHAFEGGSDQPESMWNMYYNRLSGSQGKHFAVPATVSRDVDYWEQTFGGSADDAAYDVQETVDGGFIITGFTESYGAGQKDAWLIKAGLDGTEQWNRNYGGEWDDWGRSVIQMDNEEFLLTFSGSTAGSEVNDLEMIRLAPDGGERLARSFGGSGREVPCAGFCTDDSGYILAGSTASTDSGDTDFWLLKIDEDGNQVWDQTYGGEANERAHAMQLTADGIIMTGSTESFGAGLKDVWLVKTDMQGTEQWQKTFGTDSADVGFDVRETQDMGYIITGYTASADSARDIWLIKTDSDGNIQWSQVYGGANDDLGKSVRQTPDGGYIVAGRTESWDSRMQDVILLKTDSEGEREWKRIFSWEADDFAEAVCLTMDGGYAIAGGTTSMGSGGCDVLLIKTNAIGFSHMEPLYSEAAAETFCLFQNYPNPFNSSTVIPYSLPAEGSVKIYITDIRGREISCLLNERRPAGHFTAVWDAANFSSGIYFAVIETGSSRMARKLLLLK